MPRLGRVVLPNYPHHVVQRGHNKQAVFAEEADYLYYLNTLEEFKVLYDVKVYGFCLMTNHVHLILQPGEPVSGMGQLMKRLAGRQTRFVNRQESNGNALGESVQIQSGRYRYLFVGLLPLCGVESGESRNGWRPCGVPLV